MDGIKDISEKDSISRFLDNRTLRIQPFGSNVAGERAYRRAERLAAAVHLITNHIPPEEPARSHVRESSLALLSGILSLRDEMRSQESSSLKNVLSLVRRSISLIRTLSVSGYVSRENSQTLVEALDSLGSFLVSAQRTNLSEGTSFSRDEFLDVEYQMPVERPASAPRTHARKPALKDRPRRENLSDRNGGAKERAERIASMLATRGKQGIKDIATNLPEYSEKMIQRELKNLVKAGRVRKEGSKRWSTYSLAQ